MAELPVTVVVLTHDRPEELAHTLRQLLALPQRPAIVVADNASAGGGAEAVVARLAGGADGRVAASGTRPEIEVVRCPRNLGAAGRNEGVARVQTPFVAFCDDDTWWAGDALPRAVTLLTAHPRLGAVAARVLVEPAGREDPTCAVMAGSPLPRGGLPGPALIGFMAGAVVMRTAAFREVGGYEPRLFIGGEERLMGLDLAEHGWQMMYAADVVAHHRPSPRRDAPGRRTWSARNALWIAWMRLPCRTALVETTRALAQARSDQVLWRTLAEVVAGLPWVLSRRKVLSAETEHLRRLVLDPARAGPRARPQPARDTARNQG